MSVSTRHDKIESIRVMLRELCQVAQAERCDMLAYLIEMSYIEASDILRGVRPATVKASPRLVSTRS